MNAPQPMVGGDTSNAMPSSYDQIRAEIETRITELKQALKTVDWLESLGKSPDPKLPTVARHGSAEADRKPSNEKSWADAVDEVLSSAHEALTVQEIVAELKKRGRKFPGKTREDVPVRGVLSRRATSLHWSKRGKKWTKHKEAG